MIEKFFDALPVWAKSKLMIRMIYTGGSFITAHIVAFLTGDYLNNLLAGWMILVSKVGIYMTVHIDNVDKAKLQAWITGLLMVAGEWAIQHFHSKIVIPHVEPKPEAAK